MRSKRSKKRSKFASLNKHLAPTTPPQQQAMEDDNDSQQVACLLEENTEAGGGATITDLFGNSSASSSSAVIDEVLSPASPSGLARRALRGRERWVFCRSSSPVTQSQSQRCVDVWSGVLQQQQQQQGLQLKLDYDEIMSSWSDRGSLYIHGDGPQVVPQLPGCGFEDDNAAPSVFVEVGNGNGWRVPEMEVEVEGKERGDKIKINREERVMRYKAKRQSRLFAKRIRYQVRKLNAEKRPRIKGRFVKRVEDM